MIRKLLFMLLFTSNYTNSQNTVGTTEITSDVFEGFTLFTVSTETYLINNCGEVVNQWTSAFPPGNAVYLLDNGNILRAGRTNGTGITFGGQGGVIEIFDWDGNLNWQYFYDSATERQHHDVYPMPNGNVLILAATRMTNTEAIQAGRNPSLLSESDLYNEQIIEVTPIGTDNATVVWEWNIKDHLIQDFDSSKDNFGDISLNPEKLDINFLNGGSGGSNWLHFNSIQYHSELDQIVISSRNLSEIYIIDHSTSSLEAASSSGGLYGKGGDFLYRWGNPQSYKQGNVADRRLYGQHYAYIIESGIDEGKIILFNNGNGRDPLFSEVFIINPPSNGAGIYSYTTDTAYGPINPDYIYEDPINSTDFFSGILSSAQRLPNGNILVCEGINGRIFEITPDENTVWEYIIPVNSNNGNVVSQGDDPLTFTNTTFRGIKYATDFAAFSGRDLTPSSPIELNPNLDTCSNLSDIDFVKNLVNLSPNPTRNVIKIESNETIDKIEVYNLLGSKVGQFYNPSINLSKQLDGIYLLRIYFQNTIINKKVIKTSK